MKFDALSLNKKSRPALPLQLCAKAGFNHVKKIKSKKFIGEVGVGRRADRFRVLHRD